MPTKTQQPDMQKVPKLRFAGFEGGWEEKKLGKVFDFLSTNSLSRNQLNYEGGKIKNIHYGDIHTRFKSSFNIEHEEVPYINSDVDISKIKNESYCQVGDLVVADASEDYKDIGKTIELITLQNTKVTAGLHTFLLRRKDKVDLITGFPGYLMKTEAVRIQMMKMATGISVLGISKSNLSKIEFSSPSSSEQQKIAGFLGGVDEWIENLRAQKESFESYKKGMMQKIFSQEIHFKDDKGNEFPEWEEKKLGDVADFYKGNGISKDDIVEGGQNKCIRYGELYTEYDEIINDVKSRTDVSKEDSFLSKKNDILIPSSGETSLDIASVSCVNEDDIILGGDLNIIRPHNNQSGEFFAYYLTHFQNKNIAKLAQGNSVVHLYASHLKTLKVNLPSFLEQQKIADFLTSVDKVLESKQQQITQAEQWKKGLMQGLFV